MKRIQLGFTLTELMIAVAIIGVLAAIAIPQYQNYVSSAQAAEGLSLMSGAKTAVAEHYMTTGGFPEDNSKAGLSDAETITGNYVESVTVADEKITAKFKPDGVNENIKGKSLLLTATDAGGSVTFECETDIDESYAPTGCKSVASVGGPTAWSSLTSEEQAATTACWDQSVAESREDGNGYVEGPNTYTGSQQDVRQVATICGFGECRGCALCPFALCDG